MKIMLVLFIFVCTLFFTGCESSEKTRINYSNYDYEADEIRREKDRLQWEADENNQRIEAMETRMEDARREIEYGNYEDAYDYLDE